MLDAYIIDRIRREREQSDYIPLRIEPPPPPRHAPSREDEGEQDEESQGRGVLIIEYFSEPD